MLISTTTCSRWTAVLSLRVWGLTCFFQGEGVLLVAFSATRLTNSYTPKRGQRLAALAEEHRRVGRLIETTSDDLAQDGHGTGSQGAEMVLAALAENAGARRADKGKFANGQPGRLAGPGPRVVQQQQKAVVTAALGRRERQSGDHRDAFEGLPQRGCGSGSRGRIPGKPHWVSKKYRKRAIHALREIGPDHCMKVEQTGCALYLNGPGDHRGAAGDRRPARARGPNRTAAATVRPLRLEFRSHLRRPSQGVRRRRSGDSGLPATRGPQHRHQRQFRSERRHDRSVAQVDDHRLCPAPKGRWKRMPSGMAAPRRSGPFSPRTTQTRVSRRCGRRTTR